MNEFYVNTWQTPPAKFEDYGLCSIPEPREEFSVVEG